MNAGKNEEKIVLTAQERRVLNIMRGIEYGELRVVVQAGKPVRIEEIRKSVQL